ncbi:hypothetical protein [Anabaena azotica]|uniref:Uncharacterized protein n=1 Tax=Anabaena azotica FACHB-119 TaxID=947527 RepID=A0ABR8D694_9NOST|nr:hypothetical protein [Anabaena azotica]MBD2501666.1 hypothetical protein [Anabaena azotica FACHB-119]
MQDYELIWDFLREFFNYEHYAIAIEKARYAIASNKVYKENWLRIVQVIQNRELLPRQPLTLVHEGANQVLDENSDDEAYIWLAKMVHNVERTDGKIEEY